MYSALVYSMARLYLKIWFEEITVCHNLCYEDCHIVKLNSTLNFQPYVIMIYCIDTNLTAIYRYKLLQWANSQIFEND